MATSSKSVLSFYTNESDQDSNEQVVEGYFSTPHTKAWLRLDEDLESAEYKSKTYHAYLTKLDRLIAKEPDYLDAYNNAGSAFLEVSAKQEFPERIININLAQEYYSRAFERANVLIPTDFSGYIRWGSFDNRPFLRSHHGLILCHLRKKEYAVAAQMIEDHLAWNPDDNIGVRYLLGDTYLVSGDIVNARRAFAVGMTEGMLSFPDNAYSLGLLEFRDGNYVAAATALRTGFLGNMYIAEILTGRAVEKPHFFWHSNSWASVDAAKSYLFEQDMLSHWKTTPQAVDFVDWLYNSATVLRERLECAEIREGLTYEHNFTARGKYCNRDEILKKNIAKVTMLIRKITNRSGEKCWPWEYSQR